MLKCKKLLTVLAVGVSVTLWSHPLIAALPDISSMQVLVNKHHPLLPKDYVPAQLTIPRTALASSRTDTEMELRKPAALALAYLFAAARQQNISLVISSGYRSYQQQLELYVQQVATEAPSAEEAIAQPGNSEHQTGLALDIVLPSYFCAAQDCFAMTKAASWLATNSYQYGFILRYPPNKESITGYEYEPWHYRYVGVPLARTLQKTQQTLEEYYKAQ